MTGMDEYEKLKELYEHMMVVRKDSRQHIQELCVALDNGLWFPERQQQAVRDDLQALSQAQDALCQALAQVQIATADKADELGERIEAWHREQENREAMKAMVHQLEGIFDVAYVGTDESIASQFRQMQGDVKALLGLSLTFDELSARAEKYIRFLEAVHFDGPLLDRDLADSLRSQFGGDISLACIYHDFRLTEGQSAAAPEEPTAKVPPTPAFTPAPEPTPVPALEKATSAPAMPDGMTLVQQKPLRAKLKGAKSFTHDIQQFAEQTEGMAIFWLMALCFHDFVGEGEEARLSRGLQEQQKRMGAHTFENSLQAIRSRFLDWGLAAKYQWGTQPFYRLTPETYDVLKRDKVRKYFNIPYFTRMTDWTCFSRLYEMERFVLQVLDHSPYEIAFFRAQRQAFFGYVIFGKSMVVDDGTFLPAYLLIRPPFSEAELEADQKDFQYLAKSTAVKLLLTDSREYAKPWLTRFGTEDIYVALTHPDEKGDFLFSSKGEVLTADDLFAVAVKKAEVDIPDCLDIRKKTQKMLFLNEHVAEVPDLDRPDESDAPGVPEEPEETEKTEEVQPESVPSEEAVPDSTADAVTDRADALQSFCQLLQKGHQAEGSFWLHALASTAGPDEEAWDALSDEIAYILDDPLYDPAAHSDGFDFWDSMISLPAIEMGQSRDVLNAAAMVRAFFAPAEPKGYLLSKTWSRINEEPNEAFTAIPVLKQFVSLCKNFADTQGMSLAYGLQQHASDRQPVDLDGARQAVAEQYQALCMDERKPSPHPRLRGLRSRLYGGHGQVVPYFKDVDAFSLTELSDFCNTFLNTPLTADTPVNRIEDRLVNENKVKEYLDGVWFSIPVGERKNERFLGKDATQQIKLIKKSVLILCRYILAKQAAQHEQNQHGLSPDVLAQQRQKGLDLLQQAQAELAGQTVDTVMDELAKAVLQALLNDLTRQFQGCSSGEPYYAPLLKANAFELDSDYLPDLTPDYDGEYPLVPRLQRYIQARLSQTADLSWQEAYHQAVRCYNLGLAKEIAGLDDTVKRVGKRDTVLQYGLQYAAADTENYRSDVELAANYGKIIGKERMEHYFSVADTARSHFKKTQNFALYKDLLQSCLKHIDEEAEPRRQSVQRELDQFRSQIQEEDLSWLDPIQAWLDHGNLTIVEDYLHRCAHKSPREMKLILNYQGDFGLKTFTQFLEQYQTEFDLCNKNKKLSLKNIYDQKPGIRNKRVHDRLNRKEKDGLDFVEAWSAESSAPGKSMKPLLEGLGYGNIADIQVSRAEKNCTCYSVKFEKNPPRFHHPFAVFGSGAYYNGLNVVLFRGSHTPQSIVNEISQLSVAKEKGTLFFLDSALTLSDRRELARLMKTNLDMQNVLVLDRVLALYLTHFEKNDRNDKLLALALPFAYVQPFISEARIPPEMFIGRSAELAAIQDMAGPVFVYGGRQLGKSALLRQTRYLTHHPEQGNYAIYLDIKNKDGDAVLGDTCDELRRAGILNKHVRTWDELGRSLKDLWSQGKKNIDKLMILYDESDHFLVDAAAQQNRPIEVLKDIRDYVPGHFKFIFAGLHNVIRFDRRQLGDNTVFAQLDHLVVKPFGYLEANELLLKPLSYLGFEIRNQDIISTILAQTNYFPGLIQYYGKNLVESIRSQYKNQLFTDCNTPPYPLDESYLKDLLKDEKFRQKIDDLFMITLELDADNYYAIIALVVAYQYQYEQQRVVPVTLDTIRDVCAAYEVHKIADMRDEQLQALIDEMTDLNILHQEEGGKGYVFNRYNFYMMMGDWDDIERKLREYGNA